MTYSFGSGILSRLILRLWRLSYYNLYTRVLDRLFQSRSARPVQCRLYTSMSMHSCIAPVFFIQQLP